MLSIDSMDYRLGYLLICFCRSLFENVYFFHVVQLLPENLIFIHLFFLGILRNADLRFDSKGGAVVMY